MASATNGHHQAASRASVALDDKVGGASPGVGGSCRRAGPSRRTRVGRRTGREVVHVVRTAQEMPDGVAPLCTTVEDNLSEKVMHPPCARQDKAAGYRGERTWGTQLKPGRSCKPHDDWFGHHFHQGGRVRADPSAAPGSWQSIPDHTPGPRFTTNGTVGLCPAVRACQSITGRSLSQSGQCLYGFQQVDHPVSGRPIHS